MVYPIKNLNNLKRGFIFRQLYPKSFGSLYGKTHLGLDIIAPLGTPIYAWQDLTVIDSYFGKEGGNTILIKCPNNKRLFRLMHLQFPILIGKYKENQIICQVGNTGNATTGAHLHLDISKNGKLNISDINNFEDPELYFGSLKYN